MRWIAVFVIALVALVGCSFDADRIVVNPSGTATPIISAGPGAAETAPAAPPSSEWAQLEPGVELHEYKAGSSFVQVVRFDLSLVTVRVAYDAGDPGRVSQWQSALAPLAVINGGYFDDQGRATALTIFNGVRSGASYEGFGGMLAVDQAGTVTVRSLRDQPYDVSENLTQALQSAPMLVANGQRVPQPNDDGARSRRSVVAMDDQGRLLLIVCGWPVFSLSELSQWLVDQDLGITNALNLDGGSSTGMAVVATERSFTIDSLVPVPQVLVIERRP